MSDCHDTQALPFLRQVGIRIIPRVSVKGRTNLLVQCHMQSILNWRSETFESQVTQTYPGHLGLRKFLVPFVITCCCGDRVKTLQQASEQITDRGVSGAANSSLSCDFSYEIKQFTWKNKIPYLNLHNCTDFSYILSAFFKHV